MHYMGKECDALQKILSLFYKGLSHCLWQTQTDPISKHHYLTTDIHKCCISLYGRF